MTSDDFRVHRDDVYKRTVKHGDVNITVWDYMSTGELKS